MLDTFGIPSAFKGDVQIFTRVSYGSAVPVDSTSWHKPRGVSMVNILAIGGGGGGGGGFTRAAGNAGGGGGGGGSSGVTRVTCPAWLLPDELYIKVGHGGAGVGSGGGTAESGGTSMVAIPGTEMVAINKLVASSGNPATGGGTGTGAAVGAAGTGATIATIGGMPFAGLGIFDFIAGQDGAAGGAVAGAVGTAITIPVTSVMCQGGSGGAGTTAADFAGGECTAITDSWLSQQRPATPAAGSNNGSGGPQIWKPFFSFGGLGGSSSNTGIGGAGGNGAYGAGGGGGGAGTTGGRGGDGGNGIVIITAW